MSARFAEEHLEPNSFTRWSIPHLYFWVTHRDSGGKGGVKGPAGRKGPCPGEDTILRCMAANLGCRQSERCRMILRLTFQTHLNTVSLRTPFLIYLHLPTAWPQPPCPHRALSCTCESTEPPGFHLLLSPWDYDSLRTEGCRQIFTSLEELGDAPLGAHKQGLYAALKFWI